MVKLYSAVGLIIVLSILGLVKNEKNVTTINNTNKLPVREVLEKLGADVTYNHLPNPIEGASIEKGEDLVKEGYTMNKIGSRTNRISKHFVCTSCHNLERDEPDLSKVDPQGRLEFSVENGLPMLQGTALYGIVNRSSFYNGDYYKKYGELVFAARNDLRQAIQLCATECAQGRPVNDWEMESILMYLWTIDLQLDDLNISETEHEIINEAIEKGRKKSEAIEIIESKYLKEAPAHFLLPPQESNVRKAVSGDPDNGELIYTHSCMHCHDNRRYSFFNLDYSKLTFKNLYNNFGSYHERSIYQVCRYGTSPIAGKKAYMPQYTEEKMSRQMIEDLKAYIAREAGHYGLQ